MILDRIIEMQVFLLKQKRKPTTVLINLADFTALVKELETDRYLDKIHNMKIEIVNSHQLILV